MSRTAQRFQRFLSIVMIGVLFQTSLLPLGVETVFAAEGFQMQQGQNAVRKGQKHQRRKAEYRAGQVIVKFKDGRVNLVSESGKKTAKNVASKKELKLRNFIPRQNIGVMTTDASQTVEDAVAALQADPDVEYAEPNYVRETSDLGTNDTHKDSLWALDNVGQTINGTAGIADADMDVPEAWAISEGQNATPPVIVAVIDTGVLYTHEDLTDAMWDGSSCVTDTGVPLGNCQHGYDFADNDTDPTPIDDGGAFWHGTAVSGVVAATKNNGKGVAGIAPKVKIMALRFGFDIASEVRAIDFAIQNGAKVINASYGGSGFSQAEHDAIQRFRDAGGLFVAAAGNFAENNDTALFYPASYTLDNILSVAATDQSDGMTGFSNFGLQSVDVGAPGIDIRTTTVALGAGTSLLSESFDTSTPPVFPAAWISKGAFGTKAVGGSHVNVARGDAFNMPYKTNGTGTLTTANSFSLAGSTNAQIAFNATCDTQYQFFPYTDYMVLEGSTGSTVFKELMRFDEIDLDNDGNDAGVSPEMHRTLMIPDAYRKDGFTFRFRWITNGDNNTGSTGEGCSIDDVTLSKNLTNGGAYAFVAGTSFSSPYAAGLAGLILGYNPLLSMSDVRQIILNSGDSLPSLVGKTVTGKRINAANALAAAAPVVIPDTTAPVITLLGSPTVMLNTGDSYTDAGATASDNVDGDITANIVKVSTVNTAIAGNYSVTYNVSDAAGNAATQVTRTVTVSDVPVPDTTAPVITLLGSPTVNLMTGEIYTDAGATASDNVDGDISANMVKVSTVNTAIAGNYSVTYNVSDAAGNVATQVARTVTVTDPVIPDPEPIPDTTAPVITLLGSPTVILTVGDIFVDAGATASDNIDGDITANIVKVSTVNTAAAGTYSVTYNVSDVAGNTALEVARTVIVNASQDGGDDTPPTEGSSSSSSSSSDETVVREVVPVGKKSGGRSGHGTNSLIAMAAFVARQNGLGTIAPPAFGGGDEEVSLSDEQKTYVCSMQRALPKNANAGVIAVIAQAMLRYIGHDVGFIIDQLTSPSLCSSINAALRPQKAVTLALELKAFPVGEDDMPVSSNPLWNLCVRNMPLTYADIRSNPDTDSRGRHYSCDHYHQKAVWRHPDLDLSFTWNAKDKKLVLPAGFTAEKRKDIVIGHSILFVALPKTAQEEVL